MSARLFALDSLQTFDELEHSALGVAESLRERGVTPATRVMLKAGNSAAYVTTLLALMHVGASIVLVDQQENAAETQRVCNQAGVKISLVDEDAPLVTDGPHTLLYELLVAGASQATRDPELRVEPWCELPDGLIMYSSGSTGVPKGVVKNGGRFLKNLQRNADQVGHHSGDVLMPMLPFSHQYGLSMVLIAWLVRCSLVVAPYRRIDRALRMAGQCGVTVTDGTPSTYQSILNIVKRNPRYGLDLAGVRMFCSGAAPLGSTLSEDYVAWFGLPLLDSYGSTELGNLAFATPENPVGCGRALPGHELRILDDEGNSLPAGQTGEIVMHCPDMMAGYLAADGSLEPAEQGWRHTSDFGYLDENDNLFVVGRKFAVHRKGHTLYPEIIEHKVTEALCPVKIIALPDERRGCQLAFFVEDPLGHDGRHWRTRIAEVLPEFERPDRIRVVDRFPLNRNGKPDKKRMTELALAESASSPKAG
ncbi:class I adenylate-forming enzyme family protein [Amycolatopsis sp. CB00013]|uniref:class I adenylate-forming enzyme family protein n=1 Tax=Amycolatopsis sp. CB00013 TaxID=1703945 RepID=UPI00093AA9BF|nr:class I adenylate-forming enzyme family protein [Amycolatopsis sp. CB00013]OKJ91372.1 acyl--CoA ligase [Amycolatopsis sp. CB00013]